MTDTVIEAGQTRQITAQVKAEEVAEFIDEVRYLRAFITGISKDMVIGDNGYVIEIK